jgi:hypothetical protein
MSKPLKGVLRHQMPGRMRVSLEHPLPDRDMLASLAERLAAARGAEEIEIRPQSGSIIVRYQGDYEDLVASLRHAGLQIEAPPARTEAPKDPIEASVRKIAAADTAIRRWTGGRTDVWGLSYALLVLTGLIQLGRGKVAGPALTVFGQAATLAMARPLKRFF